MTIRSLAAKASLPPLGAVTLGVLGAVSAVTLGALGAATPAGASAKVTTVKVIETEYHLSVAKKHLKPGHYVFVAVNKGHVTHALEITGPGLKNASTPDISPGQSVKLNVTLRSGRYDIFCPVPGHKMLGMNGTIAVSGKASTTASRTPPATAGSNGAVSY